MKKSKAVLSAGNLQKQTDIQQHKFQPNDKVYVIDMLGNGTLLKVKEHLFNAYTDNTYKKATIKDSSIGGLLATLRTDSIFATSEEASRFGIVFLVKRKEPSLKINSEKSVLELYAEIEEEHPELILKYMKFLIN